MKLFKYYFPDVIKKIKNKEISASNGASIIANRITKDKSLWSFDWLLKQDTVRKILSKLAKATTQKNK